MSNVNSPVRVTHTNSHHQHKWLYVINVHSQDPYLPKKHKESGNYCRLHHTKLLRYKFRWKELANNLYKNMILENYKNLVSKFSDFNKSKLQNREEKSPRNPLFSYSKKSQALLTSTWAR